jgi:hypothetical protein
MILEKFVEAFKDNLVKAVDSGFVNNETTQKAVFTITARMFHDSNNNELVNRVFDIEKII